MRYANGKERIVPFEHSPQEKDHYFDLKQDPEMMYLFEDQSRDQKLDRVHKHKMELSGSGKLCLYKSIYYMCSIRNGIDVFLKLEDSVASAEERLLSCFMRKNP